MTKPADLAVCPCKADAHRSDTHQKQPPSLSNPHLHNPELVGDEFFWPAGPTGILLCHGFTATTAEVRPLARCLLAAGYTVAGPLLPGHNTSPQDLNRVRWQDWVQSYDEILERLYARCEKVILGGESTGALLSLMRAIHDPRPAAILAYAPALKLSLSLPMRLFLHLLAPFKSSWPKRAMMDGTPWQGYRVYPLKGTLELIKLQKQIDPMLSCIHQPILIVQGRKDATVHPSVPERIAQQVSSTVKEIHWMPESSHTVIVDREMERVFQITLDFIRQNVIYQ